MSRMYNCQFRVLLIVYDLDKCQHDRIVDMPEAMTHLLDPNTKHSKPSPYISMLVIDTKALLEAISTEKDVDDHHANHVNGLVGVTYKFI